MHKRDRKISKQNFYIYLLVTAQPLSGRRSEEEPVVPLQLDDDFPQFSCAVLPATRDSKCRATVSAFLRLIDLQLWILVRHFYEKENINDLFKRMYSYRKKGTLNCNLYWYQKLYNLAIFFIGTKTFSEFCPLIFVRLLSIVFSLEFCQDSQ